MQPAEYFKVQGLSKTPLITTNKRASNMFDDLEEFEQINENILDWQIKEFRFWYGNYATRVINGVQVTYRNLKTWEEFKTTKKYGYHALNHHPQDVYLDQNEIIHKVEAQVGDVVDQLKFHTNKKLTILQGGAGGSLSPFSIEEGLGIVGLYGGTGDCLQRLGFYVAPISELKYGQKRPYLLLKANILRKGDIQNTLLQLMDREDKKNVSAETAFVLLATQGTQIFAQVMKFV